MDIGKKFECKDINEIYTYLLKYVNENGNEIQKDEKTKIKEIYNATIRIKNPNTSILSIKGRGYNPAFMVAEAIWNLCGDTSDWLIKYNARYKEYFSDRKLEAGYGNRLFNYDGVNQIEKVVKLLKQIPNTQQANAVIYNPKYDLSNPKFVPCITMLKFRIREGKLFMTTYMRAQDLWKGLPYDIFLLISILNLVAKLLNIEVGEYIHYCDTLRIYEENYSEVKKFLMKNYTMQNNRDICFKKNENIIDDIKKYKNLVKIAPNNIIDEIENEPSFWKNAIKTCYVYILIKNEKYKEARDILNSIDNVFKELILDWALKYDKFKYL